MTATKIGPPITRRPSAVALTALLTDIASHADDVGAHVRMISCAPGFLFELPDAPYFPHGVVAIQTDGPGFLTLVDHFGLSVSTVNTNIDAVGFVGLLDIPVHVYSGLAETLAAGLVAA